MRRKTNSTLVFKAIGYRNYKRVPIYVYEFAGRYEIYRGEVLWCIQTVKEEALKEALRISVSEHFKTKTPDGLGEPNRR